MKFSCDQCQAQYMIADEKVGPKGVKVRCKKCGNIISVQRDAAAASDAPTQVTQQPAAQGSAFDDLFGQSGGGGGDEEERAPTKVFTTQELDKVRQEQALAKGSPADAGGGGGDSFASQFGSEQAKNDAAPAAAAPAAKAEWYVAINDEQVGPIGDAELTQRWERADLAPSSLAWKAGMPDWQPIASIAELAHITSKPQQSQQKAAAPAAQPQAEAPVEEKKEVVTWRPSGASALADLAKEAVVEEPKRPEPQPDASPFGPDFNPQPAGGGGGGDPFNQPAFAGAGGPSTVWQFPSTASKKSSSGVPKWLLIAASFIGVALLGGIGVLAYAVINPRPPVYQQPPPQNPQTPPVAQNTPPNTPPPTTPPPTTPPPTVQNPPATPPTTPPTTPPAVAGKDKKGLKGKHKGEKEEGGTDTPPPVAAKEKPEKKDEGGFDDLLGGKKKAEVKATLSRDDVLGTVKSNAGAITKCAEAYSRGGGKLPAKLVARWVIKPSGFTDSQEMASPELKGTPVDACVVAAIKKWKFPEFQSGTIPVTFPFAVAQ